MRAAGKRWFAVVAGLALGGASALVSAAPMVGTAATGMTFTAGDFIVKPRAVGEDYDTFQAGALSFEVRSEVDQFNGSGSTAQFNETGSAQFTAFVDRVGGSSLGSGDTGLGLSRRNTTGYQLYALFSGEGTTRVVAGPRIQGSFSSFSVTFYVDPDNNTTFDDAGSDDRGFSRRRTGVIADDREVLNGRLLAGDFTAEPGLTPGVAAGGFTVLFRITGFGGTDFFAPTTASGASLDAGLFNGRNTFLSSNITFPPNSFQDGIIVGSGNNTFGTGVPEPSSLALVGLALAGGAGLSRRRRRG